MHYKITALFPFDPGSASNVLNIIAKKNVDEKEFKEKDVEELFMKTWRMIRFLA